MRERDRPVYDRLGETHGGYARGEAMAEGQARRFWRPAGARKQRVMLTALGMLAFNIGLLVLPLAGAAAALMVMRERLYTYENDEAVSRSVRARVERLAGGVIMLDFDRRRQWDDLIAMELIAGDVGAARGFLLSARTMLSASDANTLDRLLRRNADDAEVELAALELLTPGTRNRYESTVPLLSRRSASGEARMRDQGGTLGDEDDFALLARGVIVESEPDALQFTLTGLGLGLGPEALTRRMGAGAAALIDASHDENFNSDFAEETGALAARVAPQRAFREEARRRAGADGDPANYAIASEAFRAALDADGLARLTAMLDEIGQIAEATSAPDAALILTHARSLADVPRLRQVAVAAGDRAAATAKRAERDGSLPEAAQGTLAFTGGLVQRLVIAGVAAALVLFLALYWAFAAVRDAWERRFAQRDDDHEDLMDDFSSGPAY